MKFVLALLLVLASSSTLGSAIVSEIVSSTEILVDLNDEKGFSKDATVVIFSRDQQQIAAIGIITKINPSNQPNQIRVEVTELVDNYLVVKGDRVDLFDHTLIEQKNIPGFYSLVLNGHHKIPSRYKDLAYFGVFTSEGHTLDQNEVLISPFQFQYGVTQDFGVRIVNALWLDGYANLGVKYRAFTNKYAKITLNALGAYKVQAQDWIGQFGGVLTMPKNSKFQSHFMLNVTFDPQYEKAKNTRDLRIFKDSDIRNITEYMTDKWNRVLFGPVYNVELQTFGGTVSHMWIWDTFHMSLGIATRDFAELKFASNAYYYVYDLFWRF